MDLALAADTVTVATQQGLGFAKSLLHRHNFTSYSNLSLADSSADQSAGGILQISAVILDAIAPPPVKPNRSRTSRRTIIRKKRRTRRSTQYGGEFGDGGEDYGFPWGGGNEGPFGGDGGAGDGGNWGNGGKGWNYDRFGGQNWDESSSWSSSSGFAYGFVYEVVGWIALSSCVHFAFKKIVRILANGFAVSDTERDKVPIRLGSIC